MGKKRQTSGFCHVGSIFYVKKIFHKTLPTIQNVAQPRGEKKFYAPQKTSPFLGVYTKENIVPFTNNLPFVGNVVRNLNA